MSGPKPSASRKSQPEQHAERAHVAEKRRHLAPEQESDAAASLEDTEEDIDVWPSIDVVEEEAKEMPVEEAGLSVDPEDLGRQWLNQATEQGNFESTRGEHDAGMHVIRLPTKTLE